MKKSNKYCVSQFIYQRWKTREVMIGHVGFGGDNPIRVQSMTTADTMDTEKTVAESIRMIDAGCELVRITAPSKKDAANLAVIKKELLEKGYDTPLVADIHFTPNAAEEAAEHVEKIRVNPGNYADKKKFEHHEYTDESYNTELERIRERFTPLVLKCKRLNRAMRIGTNHGSLSDRILSRYGDTPLGMVESAMEFLRICRDHDYHDIVISMKASNAKVMVQAYRLLVNHMMAEGMNYPLHLGVTEAGDGEDGRIKSAVGIGTLLEDGLGDTVRVSLTEAPEEEIPVARILVDRYLNRQDAPPIEAVPSSIDPFEYDRRKSHAVGQIGGGQVPVVIANLSKRDQIQAASFFGAGYQYSVPLDKWNIADMAADYIYVGQHQIDFEIPGTLSIIQDHGYCQNKDRHLPLLELDVLLRDGAPEQAYFLALENKDLNAEIIAFLKADSNVIVLLKTQQEHAMADMRTAFYKLMNADVSCPVVLSRQYKLSSEDHFRMYSATDCGALLLDGLGDGVLVAGDQIPVKTEISTAFGILQATRTRISKTEYISCPSCGRTLFDLQETTAKIRAKTSHLKGVKIGIMGCIVNGPGEMADADYGYVGTGVGKITLYKEKEVVRRNVPEAEAVDALIDLIREHGDWVEVQSSVEA
ncbi:MAG: (E)-4-hydroxy-3-methylbut-2-enyl-diphosphate synthase [Flavobacteriales bacterium]|nr:(E)-4-hydroxy-3-methylbut-2-enyl-diphosphate synthase [Flavobacteriales bacterium]